MKACEQCRIIRWPLSMSLQLVQLQSAALSTDSMVISLLKIAIRFSGKLHWFCLTLRCMSKALLHIDSFLSA